jgi:hypothetical protein
VKGKQVIIVAARGGVYAAGNALDFQVPYLKSVLGFLGMTDVDVLEVEGTAMARRPPRRRSRRDSEAAATCEQRVARKPPDNIQARRRTTDAVCHDELSLDDMLNDPLIGAVMRADGVDPKQLGAELAAF